MSQAYIGEIRMFAGSFAPAGWAFCDGSLMAIAENDALFTVIGTTYGGDGESTFGLPDLQGRVPVHAGQGPGITGTYLRGEKSGVETVTLSTQEIPVHNHAFLASQDGATSPNPENSVIGSPPTLTMFIVDTPVTPLNMQMTTQVGNSQPHENRIPTLTVTFIISLYGIFPRQS
jgi:microcystin-dependent protein